MKKVAAVLLAVGLTCAYAQAGIVSFTPDKQEVVLGGETVVNFDVTLEPDGLATLSTIGIQIGSDNLLLTGFTFDPDFQSLVLLADVERPSVLPATPPYFSDLFVQAGTVLLPEVQVPKGGLLVGTLEVDAAGLDVGTYFIEVNPERETRSSIIGAGGQEGLSGMAAVNVVPEPATLSLLAVAAVGLIHHRRRRQGR